MDKIDFKKQYKQLFNPSAKNVELVEVKAFRYIMIDGEGDPNKVEHFNIAVEALYGLSYTLKFMLKKEEAYPDYVVAPLEGLWWTDNMEDFSMDNKDIWKWTLMVMQPDFVTEAMFERAKAEFIKKKGEGVTAQLRLESLDEGLCAQIMHLGPYADEAPTVARLHNYILENGYKLRDKHHEIYLSDPRKSAPEKMKTVIRQPVDR